MYVAIPSIPAKNGAGHFTIIVPLLQYFYIQKRKFQLEHVQLRQLVTWIFIYFVSKWKAKLLQIFYNHAKFWGL